MSEQMHIYEAKVLGADYSYEARAVLLHIETEKGQCFTQIRDADLVPNVTNWHEFSEADVKMLMKGFCEQIIGKVKRFISDPELQNVQLA